MRAPIARCFDLARDVDAHARTSAFTAERVVPPGRTSGLLELGEAVTFEGRHFGVRWRMTAAIVELNYPVRFVDEIVHGPFRRLRHVHEFVERRSGTEIVDTLEWEAPLGWLGRLVDRLFLERHMTWYVTTKRRALRSLAECATAGMGGDYEIRLALASDAEALAAAHRDSIVSIGPAFYPPDVVAAWGSQLAPDLYVRAMERGEVFYIAVGVGGGIPGILGFASHRVDDGVHGTAVYVRGAEARRGIGSALFQLAEAHAVAAGARSIEVDASLAAVEFYQANGFEEVGRGDHRLPSGARMSCVFMRKVLARGR